MNEVIANGEWLCETCAAYQRIASYHAIHVGQCDCARLPRCERQPHTQALSTKMPIDTSVHSQLTIDTLYSYYDCRAQAVQLKPMRFANNEKNFNFAQWPMRANGWERVRRTTISLLLLISCAIFVHVEVDSLTHSLISAIENCARLKLEYDLWRVAAAIATAKRVTFAIFRVAFEECALHTAMSTYIGIATFALIALGA